MTNYLRLHWYYLGGILFAALSFFCIFWSDAMSHVQLILLASFMAMLIHQCEEYAWPGGFPSMANIVMCRHIYDRSAWCHRRRMHFVPDPYSDNAQ